MKARLINKTTYNIERAEIINSCLELDMKENTAEELQEVFRNPANLSTIELMTDEGSVFSKLEGWTKYGGITLSGEKKTVILTQAASVTEERLTAAESAALEAKQTAERQTEEIAEIKEKMESGSFGVDQALITASVVVARANAQELPDAQALEAKALYDTFDNLVKVKYTAEKQGFKFRDGDDLWKTAQDNVTFQAQYRPGQGTESLYTHIDEAHAGTQEDPIPAKANMEYEYGKYYSEGDAIYICKRGGVEDPESMYGQKVTLQYLPSTLIGQYFEQVVSEVIRWR